MKSILFFLGAVSVMQIGKTVVLFFIGVCIFGMALAAFGGLRKIRKKLKGK